jgi:hypothetical protein
MEEESQGRKEEVKDRGVNLIKVHYMHVWKYHNEIPPVQLIFVNKRVN